MRLAAAVVALASLLVAVPASADGDKLAVVEVAITGDADASLTQHLDQALVRAITASGLESVPLSEVRAVTQVAGCLTASCLEDLGQLLGATGFVTAKIEAYGSSYTIEITYRASASSNPARRELSCTACTIDELKDLVTARTGELLRGVGDGGISVSIRGQPVGAEIRVGDAAGPDELRTVGKTPATITLPPGSYVIEVRRSGYVAVRESLQLVEGSEARDLDLKLVPVPRRPYRIVKWGAAAGAVATLAAGGILIAIDGNPTCDAAVCPEVRNTMTVGIITTVAGLGLAGAAGWMFWADRDAAREKPRSAWLVHPRGVAWATTF